MAIAIGRVVEFFGSREKPAEGRVLVSPDLCQYDLKEPGQDDVFWKKRVTLAATYRELTILEVQCLRDHQHQQVRGNVKVDGRWQGRAVLSAKYPTSLGLAWSYVISLVVSRVARGGIPRAVQQRSAAD